MGESRQTTLRNMMHIAGVDVKPLDDLLGEQEALEAQGKQIPKQLDENLSSAAAARLESLKQAGARAKEAASTASKSIEEVQSQGREAATGINSSMEANIEKLGEKNPIISGRSDLLLKGKTTEEIRQDAMNHLFGNAKVAGITNPTGYIMLTFGLMKMAMGNPYGILNRSIRSFSRRCLRPSKESIFSRLDVRPEHVRNGCSGRWSGRLLWLRLLRLVPSHGACQCSRFCECPCFLVCFQRRSQALYALAHLSNQATV